MKESNVVAVLFIGFMVLFVVALSVIIYAGTSTPYSMYNSGWNGLSYLEKNLNAHELPDNIDSLDRKNNLSLLVIIREPVDVNHIKKLLMIAENGGRIIVLCEDSSLIQGILDGINIENSTIIDPVFHYKSSLLPVAHVELENRKSFNITLNIAKPMSLDITWTPFIYTSQASFSDENNNRTRELYEKQGPLVVGAYKRVGDGVIYIISDVDVFTNSMLEFNGNIRLLRELINNTELYVDPSYAGLSWIDNFKLSIESVGYRFPRIGELAFIALIAIGYGIILRDRFYDMYKSGFRIARIASYYIIVISFLVLYLYKDYLVLFYDLFIIITLIRFNMLVGMSIASFILHISSYTIVLPLTIPVIVIYPYIYRKKPEQGMYFLGPSSINALQNTFILTPLLVVEPIGLPLVLSLITSVFAWSIRGYRVSSRVKVELPLEGNEAVIGHPYHVHVIINSPQPVIARVWVDEEYVTSEVTGYKIINIEKKFSRLGYREINVKIELWDTNTFSYRSRHRSIAVNVVPSLKKLMDILDSVLGGFLESGTSDEGGSGEKGLSEREGLESGVSGRGSGEGETDSARKVLLPSKGLLFVSEGSTQRSFRGEFYGVREYIPGDDPKSIHWKKSVSRNELVVKEFSREPGGGGGGFTPSFIIADLVSSSDEELDQLSYKLLALLLRVASVKPRERIFLLLNRFDGLTELIVGDSVSVLSRVYSIFKNNPLRLSTRYNAMSRNIERGEVKSMLNLDNEFYNALKRVYSIIVSEIIEAIETSEIEHYKYYIILNGSPTRFKYAVVSFLLEEKGFRAIDIGIVGLQLANLYARRIAAVI